MPAYVYGKKNATQIVALNQPAVVRCPAGGYPSPMVYWWRNRERLPLVSPRYEFMRDYSLHFYSIQLYDLGPYTCHVWNRVSTRPATIKITLKAIGPARAANNNEAKYLQYIIDPAQAPITQPPSYPYRPTRPPAIPPPIYEDSVLVSPGKSAFMFYIFRNRMLDVGVCFHWLFFQYKWLCIYIL